MLEGGSHEHVKAALDILRGQLKCVWRVAATLRHQRHLCSKQLDLTEHDISLAATKSESHSEQIERASDVVSRGLKSKLPDAGVLHRLLLSLFPVLSGSIFEASGPAFPCSSSSGKNSTPHENNTDVEAQKEAQGVRMNIDGMRLEVEDDSDDSSSGEEPAHALTSREAESLSVLVLQVRTASSGPTAVLLVAYARRPEFETLCLSAPVTAQCAELIIACHADGIWCNASTMHIAGGSATHAMCNASMGNIFKQPLAAAAAPSCNDAAGTVACPCAAAAAASACSVAGPPCSTP